MKKTYYTSSYFSFLKFIFFLHFDLGIDLTTLKMTLNPQKYYHKWISRSKSHEKEVLHMFLAFFVKKWYFRFLDLEIDLLTSKMTLNNQSNFRNGLPSQNHMKIMYYTCSLLHLLKNHIWPWNWPLTLNVQKCSNFTSWHSSDLNSAQKNL